MPPTRITTYGDLVDLLEDAMRLNSSGVSLRTSSLKRIILDAYDEFMATRPWKYLREPYRLPLSPPQSAGTVTFQQSGDTYTNEVTLSGATWPSWAQDGALVVGGLLCQVDEVKSDTVLTLLDYARPYEDLTDVTYKLSRDWYVLPADFAGMEQAGLAGSTSLLKYLPPDEMLRQVVSSGKTGTPRYYTIAPAQGIYGRMALRVSPMPTTATALDFIMRRQPRQLRHTGKDANDFVGTISSELESTTITGSGTAFSSTMEGAIFRANLSSSTTDYPTGLEGKNPAGVECSVISVIDENTLVVDSAPAAALDGVRYSISDPVDVPSGAFTLAISKLAELLLARRMDVKNIQRYEKAARSAMKLAKSMDGGMVRESVVAGSGQMAPLRLEDLDANG